MKNLVLLGALVAAAAVPGIAAADPIAPCQIEAERQTQPERVEQTAAPTPPAPRATQGQRTAEQQPQRDARRRGGKGVPDAELIGPRGAL